MLKTFLFAVLFIIIGLVSFALLAPLVFSGDFRKIGTMAAPVIVIVCGATGFWFGLSRKKKL
ncbi:MAG TPA: hypothetical protein DCQ92_17480 [Verrucomicrobia subdivision 3 bacterium]|nr:hypothetical protein [Limisphaerales bacterium]